MSESKNKKVTEDTAAISSAEFKSAEGGAKSASGTYSHKFATPFEYEKKTYATLDFHFDQLKGRDSRAIYEELAQLGKNVVVPAFSQDYLVCMCARASGLSGDAFDEMSLRDHNKIMAKARSFLLKTES